MAPNNHDQSSIRSFLKNNLRKGYSLRKLRQSLESQGISKKSIDQAVSSITVGEYEQDAIAHVTAIIKSNLDKGFSSNEIMSNLEDKGISHQVITKALGFMKGKKPKAAGPSLHINWNVVLKIVAGIAVVVLLVLGVMWLFSDSETAVADCVFDKRCFTQAANRCELAQVKENMGGSTIVYKSFRDCTLTKEFLVFSPGEPAEVRSFFENKFMSCPYEFGSLPAEYTRNIVGGIDSCSGDLVTALYELELALADLDEGAEDER